MGSLESFLELILMLLSASSVRLMDVNSFILIMFLWIHLERRHDSISEDKVLQKAKRRTILMNVQVNRLKSLRFFALIEVVESWWDNIENKMSGTSLEILLNYHLELRCILHIIIKNVSKHWNKHFKSSQQHTVGFTTPFYRWEKLGSKRFYTLPKVSQLKGWKWPR